MPEATAALTIDEVVYILSREEERDTAIDLGRRILEFPHLRILAIEGVHVLRALSAMESHPRLSPRDAIHYATMREHGIHAIVSDDQDFADLPDISIHSLESFAGG